jgi:hypothetical protein
MMQFTKTVNLCIQMAPLNAIVQKEGRRLPQLKGKHVAHLLALIQAIWLKGIRVTVSHIDMAMAVSLNV